MDENQESNPEDTPDKKRSRGLIKKNLQKFKHLIGRSWRGYLMDTMVVIIGITVSFSLNNQKEEGAREKLAHGYLYSLLSDVESDIKELNHVMEETRGVIDKTTRLISITELDDLSRLDTIEFLEDIKVVLSRPSFISKDATFSDMKSSGNVQLIDDVKLKNLIFEYYRVYEIVKMNQLAEREATITITGPYLFRRFPLRSISKSSGQHRNLDIKRIVDEVEFENNLLLRLSNRQELLDSYQEALRLGMELRNGLKKRTK